MRIVVLCPHFDPDTAPTGRVMTRIVEELAARGHHVDVVTALPWYRHHRVEPGWQAPIGRRESSAWGSITRVNPFAGDDKRNLVPAGARVRRFLGARPRRRARRRRAGCAAPTPSSPCRRR